MENFTVVSVAINKGNFYLLSIVKRYAEDETSMYWDDDILTFGNHFSTIEAVKEFKEGRLFKQVFKATKEAI